MTVSELLARGEWLCCECSRPTSGAVTLEFEDQGQILYYVIASCARHNTGGSPIVSAALMCVTDAVRDAPDGAFANGCRTFLVSVAEDALVAYPAQMPVASEATH